MATYTCFTCPTKEYGNPTLQELCPKCGREYGFPLRNYPKKIGDFTIINALGRGYYGATFLAELGELRSKYVLKVVPVSSYLFFAKDFKAECRLHAEVAEETEHVVPIRNMFLEQISFAGVNIPCHVAQLDYVDGPTLDEMLASGKISARTAAQIAIDLFTILDELRRKRVYHNDLHGRNLIVKPRMKQPRLEALDGNMSVIAVDLGSISGETRSDPQTERLGDLHWIGHHIKALADQLLNDPEKTTDLEYRMASVLDDIAGYLALETTSQRLPTTDDYARKVRDAFHQVSSPWRNDLRLINFNDSYNAQTLEAWYVPHLLVDPDDQWLNRISTPGPQVITGMRGCGKTMLLRSLQFHARATAVDGEGGDKVLARLRDDRFLGLYASSTRLLERLGAAEDANTEPYARLLITYGLEALRAIRHLKELAPDLVAPRYFQSIGATIEDYLIGIEGLAGIASDVELERRMFQFDVMLRRGDKSITITAHPSAVFPALADALRRSSPIWSNSCVLFLLDDVSTRYLGSDRIEQLLSGLLFQNSICAFKLTSEAQTFELALKSPGQIERARAGRDYVKFDLGAEVYQKISKRKGGMGKRFVEQILQRRAARYVSHPNLKPSQLLLDTTLESIAHNIATSQTNTRLKKRIYYGLTALARVCVGDIGDVISLYELILKKGEKKLLPVAPDIQSECYQDFCSRRLYDLNRRNAWLKNVALSFAESCHELLVESAKQIASGNSERKRLRQHLSIYVRITEGETQIQYDRIRELIDAGVFVFAGGSETPRTKDSDSDPIQQFKLTFRKIYGLSHFIGLAESDRFELSGQALERWLNEPSKERLIQHTGGADLDDDLAEDELLEIPESADPVPEFKGPQRQTLLPLTGTAQVLPDAYLKDLASRVIDVMETRVPHIRAMELSELTNADIKTVVVALGFEERTAESARRLIVRARPKRVVAMRLANPGKADEIFAAAKSVSAVVDVVEYKPHDFPTIDEGNVLIDVTGLPKAAIFNGIRKVLKGRVKVCVARTQAQVYYPKESDIESVIKAERKGDHYELWQRLANITRGEGGRYEINTLLG